MPREAYWILLTNTHITETYFASDGTDSAQYQIAPEYNLQKGDTVYIWGNPFNCFFAWGEVANHPQTVTMEVPREGDLERRKRMVVAVKSLKGLQPNISAEMMLSRSDLRTLIPSGYDDLVAIPLRPGQAARLNDYIRERNLDAPKASQTLSWIALENAPQIDLNAELIVQGDKTNEGRLVLGVRIPWFAIIRHFQNNPEEIFKMDPRRFEELIAGAYEREGWEVELTPRSNDKGRDVVATRRGIGSIRIFDEVKRYKISRPVTAKEVRALVGTIDMKGNVSKGVLTTTSHFAPNLLDDPDLARLIPHRIELKPREILLPWLGVAAERKIELP